MDSLTQAFTLQLAVGAASALALTAMLIVLGRAAMRVGAPSPAVRSVATAATLGVAGAFAPIAFGLVALIGAAEATLFAATPGPLAPIGATLLALGVGFSIAAATLRAALDDLCRANASAAPTARGDLHA